MYTDAHLRLPPLNGVFEPSFYVPFAIYFVIFQLIGYYVRSHLYTNYSGFKQYRLRNLTVCLIHSTISGLWALTFLLAHPYIFFFQTLHWYQPWAAQLPIISMAYFVCDTIDMIRHEISRWTIELLAHHTASLFVFGCSALSHKFLPYAYGALLMEVNSIFLHIRSLMQILEKNVTARELFGYIRVINIFTFVIFRFAVQAWQITWAWQCRYVMHSFYVFVGTVGGSFFLVINIILFIRVMASDGFLGEFGKRHTAINRDKQGSAYLMKDTKNS